MSRIQPDPRLPERVALDIGYLKLLNVRLYELFRSIAYAINSLVDEMSAAPYELRAAQGLVPGVITINKFGRNPDVDTGTEDIWAVGGLFVPPTAARVHAVVSASANDTAAGTGARTLSINGLDANYADQTETITMNGVTPVNTAKSYIIIHRAYVATAGSGAVNAGNITAVAAVDGTTSFRIVATKGQTQLGFYLVPAGYTAYLTRYRASLNAGATANVDIELFATPFGGAFNLKGTLTLTGGSVSANEMEYETPLKFAEKTLIRLRATSDANNTNVVASFDLYLVEN